nr:site-specific integrase [Methylocapsa palsarum]
MVDGLKPTAADFYVFDPETIGFAVRVRKTGGMSYIVQYKAGSGRGAPTRRVTIGCVGKLTPDEARTEARKVLGSVAHGQDPAADKANERRSLLLKDVIDAFLREHVEAKRKASTAAWVRDALCRIVKPALGAMSAAKVTRQDVTRLHSSRSKTPVQANRVLAILGALYSWASKTGYVPEGYNPARGIEKFPEQSHERFLTRDELTRLGDALRLAETTGLPWRVDETKEKAKHAAKPENRCEKMDIFAVAAIRLLILSGARLREILHARWEFIDFERGVIFLPDSKTGKKPIYLSAAAQELLSSLPRIECNPHIIPGEKDGQPRADLKRPWMAVTKAAGLEGVRIHDLRHSFASFGAAASLGLPVIGKLLGHAQPSTTARYAHLDADPVRRAVETIGATIASAMGDGAKGTLVPMPTERTG